MKTGMGWKGVESEGGVVKYTLGPSAHKKGSGSHEAKRVQNINIILPTFPS